MPRIVPGAAAPGKHWIRTVNSLEHLKECRYRERKCYLNISLSWFSEQPFCGPLKNLHTSCCAPRDVYKYSMILLFSVCLQNKLWLFGKAERKWIATSYRNLRDICMFIALLRGFVEFLFWGVSIKRAPVTGHTGPTSIKHAPALPAGPRLNHAPAPTPALTVSCKSRIGLCINNSLVSLVFSPLVLDTLGQKKIIIILRLFQQLTICNWYNKLPRRTAQIQSNTKNQL